MWCRLILICALCTVVISQTSVSAKTKSRVEVLGNFSSITHTPEDAFGYALDLWKEGDQVFGLLLVYTGAPADPPTGILENVKFDPRTRQFSFSARLSTGWLYAPGSYTPSRDRFTFTGVLGRRQVIGTLKLSDDLFPNIAPTSKRIRLRWSRFFTEPMLPPPPTYSEWKIWAGEILRRRGPKW
jgi:hypothetical protein